jgi:deoxyhypusine synthase
MKSMITTGFQATNVGLAIQQIDQMRKWRLSDDEWMEGIDDESLQDPDLRKRIRARIFLGYTSNQISSGQREVLKFLVKHKMVDVVVTTAGGIEEDLIKCFQPTYMGDFKLSGRELRKKKGSTASVIVSVPNKNYCQFEDSVTPLIRKDARRTRCRLD